MDNEQKVRQLLEMAGLHLRPEELAELASVYPIHRAAVDALYAFDLPHGEEPQTIFSPVTPLVAATTQEGA
jgi:hypothetical protein